MCPHSLRSGQVRAIDPTRFVTSAIPGVRDADEPDYAALDGEHDRFQATVLAGLRFHTPTPAVVVGGYNYSPNRYDMDHAKYPERVMVGTESFPQSSAKPHAACPTAMLLTDSALPSAQASKCGVRRRSQLPSSVSPLAYPSNRRCRRRSYLELFVGGGRLHLDLHRL